MTKKISILLIAFIYSFSVVGVSVTQHFCGGEPMPKSCGCAKSSKKSDCCSDKSVHAKIKADQKASNFKIDLKQLSVSVLNDFETSDLSLLNIIAPFVSSINGANAPPLVKQKVGIYLYNCVFRI